MHLSYPLDEEDGTINSAIIPIAMLGRVDQHVGDSCGPYST